MDELKNKLHELIDSTNDNIFLENIYRALQQHAGLLKRDLPDYLTAEQRSQFNESPAKYGGPKDFLDELTPAQLAELHKANEQYERGETIPYEEILEKYKRWERK